MVYRPPSSSENSLNFNVFMEEFNNMLESRMLAGKLIILGDFNIHMDDTTSISASKFGDLLLEYGLTSTISLTRIHSFQIMSPKILKQNYS